MRVVVVALVLFSACDRPPLSTATSGSPAGTGSETPTGSTEPDPVPQPQGPAPGPWSCTVMAKTSSTSTAGAWTNVTGSLKGMQSKCGNLSYVTARPDVDVVIAGVAQKGLWASNAGSTTWTALGTGAGSAKIENGTLAITFDAAHPGTFWENGIYDGGGAFRTSDGGTTFTQLGQLNGEPHHNDSLGVDFSDPARKTLLAGGHETMARLLRSVDGGVEWQDIGAQLPAHIGFSSQAVVLDAKTMLVGTTFPFDRDAEAKPGIFRSVDGGETWARVSSKYSGGNPLKASDGALYWPLNNQAWYDNGGMLRGTEGGTRWDVIAEPGALMVRPPIELPDGRIVAFTNQRLMISSNCGDSWSPIGPTFPYEPGGIAYAPFQKAFFIWHSDCNGVVLNDAIMRFDWDHTLN